MKKVSGTNIVIVGGGPAAVSAIDQLLHSFEANNIASNITIHIFEKGNVIGPGLPYSSKDSCYLLNLPIDVMGSGFHGELDFRNWLEERSDYNTKSEYPPRYYFGDYLKDLFFSTCEKAGHMGIEIKTYIHSEVIDIQKDEFGYRVVSMHEGGENLIQGDYIILCTGHMPPSSYQNLIGKENYIHDPWLPKVYEGLKSDSNIALIGSRLTAIDVVLKLHSIGHQGEITMFSRSGLLPAVLAKTIEPYPLKYLTLETFTRLTKFGLCPLKLDDLIKLFCNEIADAEGQNIKALYDLYPFDTLQAIKRNPSADTITTYTRKVSPIDWIQREIESSEINNKKWQSVLFAIYPIVSDIWAMLSDSDKETFLKEYNSIFMTYLAAFPLENAYKIRDLLISKQLRVIGGLSDVRKSDDNHFMVVADSKQYKAKYLFNATGTGYNPYSIPLYKMMGERGLISRHVGGGISVCPHSLKTIDKYGVENDTLFAVGELTKGSCLSTTDMTRVTIQMDRITEQISTGLRNRQRYPRSSTGTLNLGSSVSFFRNRPTSSPSGKRCIHQSSRFFSSTLRRAPLPLKIAGGILAGSSVLFLGTSNSFQLRK